MERIPKDKPVLICSNHPSAFLEACLLATHFPKSLYFLVRGDIFVNKTIISILKQLHLIPIYRSSEGFKALRSNETTFNKCHDLFKQNQIVVVYAEGNTKQEKRLRPIQKGLARIAYGALDKYPDMDLCIVPLGVNYTTFNQFRSEVMVEVGEPIPLQEFYTLYKKDNLKGISDLTQSVENRMKPLVIHINKDEDLPLAETLFLMNKASEKYPFWPVVDRSGSRYALDKASADRLNMLTDMQKQEELKKYNALDLQNIKPKMVSIIAILGKVLNFLPLWLGEKISKSKVSRIEFYASVLVGVTMFLYIFYFLLVTLIAHLLNIPAWQIGVLMIVSGIMYLYHRHQIERIKLHEIRQKTVEIRP